MRFRRRGDKAKKAPPQDPKEAFAEFCARLDVALRAQTFESLGRVPLPEVVAMMAGALWIIRDESKDIEERERAAERLCAFIPYPEERLNLLVSMGIRPGFLSEVSLEAVSIALDLSMPWLNWEEDRVLEIKEVLEEYVLYVSRSSFGCYGMQGEAEVKAGIRGCRARLRELFCDEGGCGRLEAFFANLPIPTLVFEL